MTITRNRRGGGGGLIRGSDRFTPLCFFLFPVVHCRHWQAAARPMEHRTALFSCEFSLGAIGLSFHITRFLVTMSVPVRKSGVRLEHSCSLRRAA